MSRRLLFLLLLVGAGSWFFFKNYRIDGLENLRVYRRPASQAETIGDPVTCHSPGSDDSNWFV